MCRFRILSKTFGSIKGKGRCRNAEEIRQLQGRFLAAALFVGASSIEIRRRNESLFEIFAKGRRAGSDNVLQLTRWKMVLSCALLSVNWLAARYHTC